MNKLNLKRLKKQSWELFGIWLETSTANFVAFSENVSFNGTILKILLHYFFKKNLDP